jgi:hypothetical protein
MSSDKKFGTILFSNKSFKNQLKNFSIDNTYKNNLKNIPSFSIPDSFDGKETWKDFLIDAPNQKGCISCWIFASLFVLSARLSIYTLGKYKLTFSPSKMIFSKGIEWNEMKEKLLQGYPADYKLSSQTSLTNVCSNGSLLDALTYLYCFGVPETSCVGDENKITNIYTPEQLFSSTYDVCPTDKSEMIHHRIDGYYHVLGIQSKDILFEDGNEFNIRRDIYHFGPVTSAFKVFDDFLSWDGEGIYIWDGISKQSSDFGHSIIILGWGEEIVNDKNIKYWLCLNTWGKNWGKNNGYFKFLRGTNHCEIEENVFVGYPTLPSFRLFLESPSLYRFDDFSLRNAWAIQDNGLKITSIEKILNKKIKSDYYKNFFIYSYKNWPDFSKLIASELNTIIFQLQDIEVKTLENFKPKYNFNFNSNSSQKKNNKEYILNILIYFFIFILFIKIIFYLFQ